VAISTDSPDELKKSCDAAKADGDFPFPLLSDSSLKIFKLYHAYDDFEKTPVHAVFLIDAQGKIRWQNISAEPFVDTTFLLKESKRLLAQPVTASEPSQK
jgi:peroxiredoxin